MSKVVEMDNSMSEEVKVITGRAVAGDPDAQHYLGYSYYFGVGVMCDEEVAERWIRRAAASGSYQAMSSLAGRLFAESGWYFFEGDFDTGTEVLIQAICWTIRASEGTEVDFAFIEELLRSGGLDPAPYFDIAYSRLADINVTVH